MERTLQHLENNLIGEAQKPAVPPPREGVIKFSVSSQCLSCGASLAEVTTAFLVDEYKAGYKLETESDSWRDLDSQEKRSIRGKFYTMKRATRLVLLYADSFPLMPEDPTRYKEVVRRIATAAYERLQDVIGEKKVITPGRLEKLLVKEENKNVEKSGRLPSNTPVDMVKFFKN